MKKILDFVKKYIVPLNDLQFTIFFNLLFILVLFFWLKIFSHILYQVTLSESFLSFFFYLILLILLSLILILQIYFNYKFLLNYFLFEMYEKITKQFFIIFKFDKKRLLTTENSSITDTLFQKINEIHDILLQNLYISCVIYTNKTRVKYLFTILIKFILIYIHLNKIINIYKINLYNKKEILLELENVSRNIIKLTNNIKQYK